MEDIKEVLIWDSGKSSSIMPGLWSEKRYLTIAKDVGLQSSV